MTRIARAGKKKCRKRVVYYKHRRVIVVRYSLVREEDSIVVANPAKTEKQVRIANRLDRGDK